MKNNTYVQVIAVMGDADKTGVYGPFGDKEAAIAKLEGNGWDGTFPHYEMAERGGLAPPEVLFLATIRTLSEQLSVRLMSRGNVRSANQLP